MARPPLPAPPAPPFDRTTRDRRLHELASEEFDVLVVGGGITGSGIARDAAMRGLRTALVERGDLAAGTSSASSKLVHGGLRYLEHRQLGLVFESVSERHRLRQLAPHLVRPIPFVFPVYGRRPRPLWQVSVGLWIYDSMALFRSHKLHRTLRARRTAALEPAMATDRLDGSVLYYDCMTDDARLTLETAKGAHLAGATVLPRCAVTSFRSHRSQVCGAELVDTSTGSSHSVQARVVVNATGPWTDRTLGLRGDRQRLLRPTKGVHLVVDRARLPANHAVCLFNPEDRRMVFAIPWGRRVVLGTTDTFFDGDFDRVLCEPDDVRYLLDLANRYFPDSRLGPDDVLGTYAGLRPLVAPDDESLGASQVSREHAIHVDEDGLITVAGGKLTTYRAMAAEVLGVVAERLRAEGVHVGGCQTASVRLPGGVGIRSRGARLETLGPDGPAAERELRENLGVDVAGHLQESYGGGWLDVAQRAAEAPDLAARIAPDLPYIWAEVDHAVASEMALTLRDFMRRRTQLEIRDVRQAWAAAPDVALRMGRALGWSQEQVAEELRSWQDAAEESMAWRDSAPA